MNKKLLMIALVVIVLTTLNFTAAHEIDNSTDTVNELAVSDNPILEVSNDTDTLKSSAASTHIEVADKTDFDVIGDYFKVKLADSNNNAVKNTKITFTVNGNSYSQNTDSSGIASLQIRLNDGSYNIMTKFAGNSNYKASSLTTKITIDNTREIENGMSNDEIQNIIDNAKANNVILFKGSSYSDINLVITKSLTLQSNVATTLKSSSSSPVITIKGSKASLTKIKGFKIEGDGGGIKVDSADYVKIISNDISTKGNGIVSLNTKYLNITGNTISKNSKSGISVAESSYVYIFSNKITDNAGNGIEVAKSKNIYIHGNTLSNNGENGIALIKSADGVNYGEGPCNVYINKNTISKNKKDGILVKNAGNNINIKSNAIESNKGNGISLASIGSNTIQSNVISDNDVGIKFLDDYTKPSKQEISYNAIMGNLGKDLEAKETYYQENGLRLDVGDNWYSDYGLVCPKIKTNNIKFKVTQIGANTFQATFLDSNGNIASLLPDRTLTYKNNGQTITITISGGARTFTVDANNGDLVRATVDMSDRDNKFDSNSKSSAPINGKTQSYIYPSIPDYQLYEDIGAGTGNGYGNGEGKGGNDNIGNSRSSGQSSKNTGNSTHSQNTDPSSSANNQVNQVSEPQGTETTSQASASDAGQSGADSAPQSVVKQIIIDEDEFFKITGISFLVLIMILTIGFYYRDEIREMKSKM